MCYGTGLFLDLSHERYLFVGLAGLPLYFILLVNSDCGYQAQKEVLLSVRSGERFNNTKKDLQKPGFSQGHCPQCVDKAKRLSRVGQPFYD